MYSVVAHDEERDRHLVGGRRPQHGDPVLRRSLPQHAHHRPVGLGQLDADRRRRSRSRGRRWRLVVAAGRDEPQAVAERRRARGHLRHRDPAVGPARPRAPPSPPRRSSDRRLAAAPGRRTRVGAGGRNRRQARRALQRQRDVADDRVAHRRAAASSGSLVIAHERRALGRAAAPVCTGSTGTLSADDENQVVPAQRLRQRPDRRRQDADEVRVVLREADAGCRRAGRAPTPASAACRQAPPPPATPRSRRCPGRRPAPGYAPPRSAAASCASSAGSGSARPPTTPALGVSARSSSASASQSSIGIDTNAGPRGGSVA